MVRWCGPRDRLLRVTAVGGGSNAFVAGTITVMAAAAATRTTRARRAQASMDELLPPPARSAVGFGREAPGRASRGFTPRPVGTGRAASPRGRSGPAVVL